MYDSESSDLQAQNIIALSSFTGSAAGVKAAERSKIPASKPKGMHRHKHPQRVVWSMNLGVSRYKNAAAGAKGPSSIHKHAEDVAQGYAARQGMHSITRFGVPCCCMPECATRLQKTIVGFCRRSRRDHITGGQQASCLKAERCVCGKSKTAFNLRLILPYAVP